MSALQQTLGALALASATALLVWGSRAVLAPRAESSLPPPAPLAEPGPARADDESASFPALGDGHDSVEPPGEEGPAQEEEPVVVVVERFVPILTRKEELRTLSEEQLWRLAKSGDPSVGMPQRIAAAEELLARPLTAEDRAEALSSLAFNLRGAQEPNPQRQVEALTELRRIVGDDAEQGQKALCQLAWPLWEMGRKEEAYRLMLDLIASPRATPRYVGLASWAAMLFAIQLERMPEAEQHFERLASIREPLLASTLSAARGRIAAARQAATRDAPPR